jgi:hypothetical protein
VIALSAPSFLRFVTMQDGHSIGLGRPPMHVPVFSALVPGADVSLVRPALCDLVWCRSGLGLRQVCCSRPKPWFEAASRAKAPVVPRRHPAASILEPHRSAGVVGPQLAVTCQGKFPRLALEHHDGDGSAVRGRWKPPARRTWHLGVKVGLPSPSAHHQCGSRAG